MLLKNTELKKIIKECIDAKINEEYESREEEAKDLSSLNQISYDTFLKLKNILLNLKKNVRSLQDLPKTVSSVKSVAYLNRSSDMINEIVEFLENLK